MSKKTKKNPRGAGRKPKFKPEYREYNRVMISIPVKVQELVLSAIKEILKPYVLDKS